MKKKRRDFSPIFIFLLAALIYMFYHQHASAGRLVIRMVIFAGVITAIYMLLKKPVKKWYRRKYDKRYIYSMDKPIQKKQKPAETVERGETKQQA
jgi:multisubunit Na+/H+ antiporter MnhB subunit